MNDDELWEFYNLVSNFTREKYSLSAEEKIHHTNATGADFISGLPANDLHCALLWHAVYKPFWNDKASNSGGPSWSWASLSQRVGWPDYSYSSRAEHVPCIDIQEIVYAGTNTLESGSDASVKPRTLKKVKHMNSMIIAGGVCRATFALHTEQVWGQTTLRKGYLTSPDLVRQVSCTMDADFSSRDVWCMPALKRKISNGTWTTHFLVLEVPADLHENGDGEEIVAASKTFRRVGTGKVNHGERVLELMEMTEKLTIVLV